MINNLQQTVDTNYITIDERIKTLEAKSSALHLSTENDNPNLNQNYENNNNKQEEYKNEEFSNDKNGNTNIPIQEKKIDRKSYCGKIKIKRN